MRGRLVEPFWGQAPRQRQERGNQNSIIITCVTRACLHLDLLNSKAKSTDIFINDPS